MTIFQDLAYFAWYNPHIPLQHHIVHFVSSDCPQGTMAFLGSAARRVALAVQPPLSPLCRISARSYSSEQTTEKSVPYKKTLKQEDGASSGPTKPLPRLA